MIPPGTRTSVLRVALTAMLVFFVVSPPVRAQSQDTVYDEAGALSEDEEGRVQEALHTAGEEAGQPLYAFLVPDTGVEGATAQRELLEREAREKDLPEDAGVILVAPDDGWAQLANIDGASEQQVYANMVPDFGNGDFAAGLISGAQTIGGEPAPTGNAPDSGGLAGGWPFVLLLAGVGALLWFRRRRDRRRRAEEERAAAEEEFADLTTRLNAFGEKERLVSGYLEAQRPLLDQRTEEWIEGRISEARTAGFAHEFNEASGLLTRDPISAREHLARGRELLDGSLHRLDEAERTIDGYRAADEALDGKLREAREEIEASETTEATARREGVAVEPLNLRREYDPLAREAADRAARREEFDPRRSLAAMEDLARRARERRTALREEVAARDVLPDERHAAQGGIRRAHTALEGYRTSHAKALSGFGPAALGDTPDPGELSAGLLDAQGRIERADRAASAGRFAEARSLLREAQELAGEVMRAPGRLKAATAEADRKKREGEEKLEELEARLAQARANEHLMDPYQRQRLREYEYQLGNARYGFFGGDWLTALLLFEALDNDFAYVGDPYSGGDFGAEGSGDDWSGDDFGGGDWGGGDFGGGDFGGGDFGGGDF